MPAPSIGRKVVSGVVVAVLGIVVVVLSVLALTQVRTTPTTTASTPAPTKTVTPEPSTTPTPTSTPVAPIGSRADERFLSFAGSIGWRATAGSCSGAAPVFQRLDGEGTWVDVLPREITVRQIASLDALTDGAEFVGAVDDDCTAVSLRTFSAGAEWASYDGTLQRTRYVTPADPAMVHTRAGDIAAPCTNPTSLRARGDAVALICDHQAWRKTDATWTALTIADAQALAIDATGLIIGHVSGECTGLALTRVTADDTAVIGCAENVDPTQPLAVAATDNGVAVWAGDSIIEVN